MGNHFPLEGGTQGGSLHTQTFKEVTLKQFQKQNFQSALKGRDIIAMGAALRQEIQPTTLVVGFMRQQKLINRFNGLKPLKRFIKFHRYLFPRINPWANQSYNGRNKIPVGQRHAFDLQFFRQEATPDGTAIQSRRGGI